MTQKSKGQLMEQLKKYTKVIFGTNVSDADSDCRAVDIFAWIITANVDRKIWINFEDCESMVKKIEGDCNLELLLDILGRRISCPLPLMEDYKHCQDEKIKFIPRSSLLSFY